MKKEPLSPRRESNSVDAGAPDAASPHQGLDEVRKRLQSYGYLNGRIERFYLSSLSRNASQFFNRVLLSFRVGLLSGTLAAILMTSGTLIFNDALLGNKLDVLLLFLYFEVFFVLFLTVLELVTIYSVAFLLQAGGGRRIRPAGQAISFLGGLVFFLYFFFWGRTQIEYLRHLSLPSLITMFLILTLSCIFVAKCLWLGFLVAFREADAGRQSPDWRRYGIEVLLSLAAVIILLPFVLRGSEKPQEEQPVAVLTTPDRWIVIAADGVSDEILNRLMENGEASFFQSLAARSFRGRLRSTQPVVPPVEWTTIATGVPSIEHGILLPEVRRWYGLSSWMQITPLEVAVHSIMADAGFGQRQPVSGYLRKRKAFWEALSDSGIRVGVVNWWGSWPARPIRGWNVSERYYYKLLSGERSQSETFPAEIFQRYSIPVKKINGLDLDRFYMRVFREQSRTDPARVSALYLPGLDILNYEFFEAQRMDPFTYTELYRQHVSWLDQMVREIREENPGASLMLIFHQGRLLKNDRSVFWIEGNGLSTEQEGEYAAQDLIPVLLYSCGMPVSRSMNTALIREVFSGDRIQEMPMRYIAAYAKKDSVEAAHAGEFNDLLIEQMKSLGYLQ